MSAPRWRCRAALSDAGGQQAGLTFHVSRFTFHALVMRLNFKGERVLAVVAHPDDAELLCAGTLARAKRDGAAIAVCVLCRGDKGQPSEKVANLAAVRRKEMRASAKLLEAQLFLGEQPDGDLSDTAKPRLQLIEVYRLFEPTLV